MPKKYSWKIWLVFWLIAAVLLAGWYVFLQVKYKNIENLKPLVNIAPVGSERQNEIRVLMDVYAEAGGFGKEKTYLLLFQNNLELRPGGGFIGAFGTLKMKNGKVADIQVFDTGNFDAGYSSPEALPYPLNEVFPRSSWKMRDSNWSPDFQTNAEKAEYFWKLGGGEENIDGAIAINTEVLNSILVVTGPVKINDYPGEYRDENAILQLEYQVEKGYADQGIPKEERKNIMGELADVLKEKLHSLSFQEKLDFAQKMEDHLKQKDIQFFFKDADLEAKVLEIGWGGEMKNSDSDYLMAVDANVNSLKSDYCIERQMRYEVDLSGNTPMATLAITYNHACRAKDWMTSDYRDFLRVYAPLGSYLEEADGQNGDVRYSEEFGKKVFGMRVFVPVGESKTVTLKYRLPESVKSDPYSLLVQKQSGSGEVPISISVKKADGSEEKVSENLTTDRDFNF